MSDLPDMIAEVELQILAFDDWISRAIKGDIKRPAVAIERMRGRVAVLRKLIAFLKSHRKPEP